MKQNKKKLSTVTKITFLSLALFVSVGTVKAVDWITEFGILKGLTVSEFLQIRDGAPAKPVVAEEEQAAGAIVMFEGQAGAVTDFVPDNNNEDSLGAYDRAFKNLYASSTLFVGSNTDETVATSTFTKLSVGNGDADFLVNSRTVCLSNGANCTGVSTAAFWTYDQAIPGWYRASSTAEKQGLGTATPAAQLEIEGDQDIVQFLVEGHTTQNAPLQRWTNSGGTEVAYLYANGNLGATGTLTVTGASRLVGAVVTDGSFTLGDASTDNFTVVASSTFNNTSLFAGLLTASSTALFSGTLTTYGSAFLGDASTDNLTVVASSTFNNTSLFAGLLTASSTALFSGTVTTYGTLNIGDASTDSLIVTASSTFLNTVYHSGALHASGTSLFSGLLTTYGSAQLGDASTDNLTVVASSTFNNTTLHAGALHTSSTVVMTSGFTSFGAITVSSSATSTMNGSYLFDKNSTTTTIQIGRTGAAGQGACLSLASGDGSGNLYLFVSKTTLQLTTSTNSRDCY